MVGSKKLAKISPSEYVTKNSSHTQKVSEPLGVFFLCRRVVMNSMIPTDLIYFLQNKSYNLSTLLSVKCFLKNTNIVKVFMHFFNCMKNLVIFLHTEHCIRIANKNVMDVIKIFDMVFLEHEQNHAMSAIFANFSSTEK